MLSPSHRTVWVVFLVAALLFLDAGTGNWYGLIVPAAALALALLLRHHDARPPTVDRQDLAVSAGLYAAVVALFFLAFRVFTQGNVLGLFLCFGDGMLLGVAGPVYYTVWRRGRPLSDLGLTRRQLPAAAGLGLLLAAVQFALTLWGYPLPAPVDWVPLAFLALAVGLFEAVFFRGFLQARLQASLGTIPGVGAAAALYALYHVGYGMGPGEMLFLFGLGVIYAIAYALVPNLVVLWPLLIPMGSFYNNLHSGGIIMPWAAILGFLDVLALMATAIWIGHRHQQRQRLREPTPAT
jgi:membrane protease YdiL (CAAX protease family)